MMAMNIKASNQACGAAITNIDLSKPLLIEEIDTIRKAWLEHHVLAFPNQNLNDDDLERFTLNFGPFGDDPFIAPIEGRNNIIAVQRAADEKASVFAEAWHTDWSFQSTPPAGTCLYGITIPPHGGDTLFANQHKALQDMPINLRERLKGLKAIHSARLAYHPDGAYGDKDQGRSMDIRPDESANETYNHPIIRPHPETSELGLYGCAGYVIGIEGMQQSEAEKLLMELHAWQTQEQFQYRHQWEEGMLVMWDNRSVLHMATGGYDGYARYLHRTTIGER